MVPGNFIGQKTCNILHVSPHPAFFVFFRKSVGGKNASSKKIANNNMKRSRCKNRLDKQDSDIQMVRFVHSTQFM